MSSRLRTWDRYPVRTCRSVHECAVCESDITLGERYYDGGYSRRAHVECGDGIMEEFGVVPQREIDLFDEIRARGDGSLRKLKERAGFLKISLSAVLHAYGDPKDWPDPVERDHWNDFQDMNFGSGL